MDLTDPEERRGNKKWCKFQSELHRCLASLEKAPISDWASLNNGLGSLQKVVDSYKDFNDVPEKLMLFRVLCKCLDPQNVAGVHRKAVETLSKICVRLGPANLTRFLPLFTASVFALLPTASMSVRPDILRCIEAHFLPLPPLALRACLGGLLAAILPTLEESETSEGFGRVMSIINGLGTKLERDPEMAASAAPLPGATVLFHALWSIVRNAPPLRVGALTFLRRRLPRAAPLPGNNDREGEGDASPDEAAFEATSILTDEVLGGDPTLVLVALNSAVRDGHEKCVRLALDVLIFHLPLHEDGVLSFGDRVQLMSSALHVLVANPTNATMRRVFMWMYGGDEVRPAYFRAVTLRVLTQALAEMMDAFVAGDAHSALVFDAFVVLQQRPDGEAHFAETLPEFLPKLCTGLLALCGRCPVTGAPKPEASERAEASPAGAGNDGGPSMTLARLFSVVSWEHFLDYINETIVELPALARNNACDLSRVASEVLGRARAIVEITRAHYTTAASTRARHAVHLERIAGVSVSLCGTLREMCSVEGLEGAALTAILRAGLDSLNVLYFGVMRGIISCVTRTPPGSRVAETQGCGDCSAPTPPMMWGGADGDDASTEADGGTELAMLQAAEHITGRLFRALTELFVAIVDGHLHTGSAADELFSTDFGCRSGATGEVALFADLADTMYFVLRHLRQEEGEANTEKGDTTEQAAPTAGSQMPAWLVRTLDVVVEGASGLAVVGAQLLLDVQHEALMSPECVAAMHRQGVARRVIERLWQLLALGDSDHHIVATKLLHRAALSAEMAATVEKVMTPATPANLRNFATLFGVLHSIGVADFPFLPGLLATLSSLSSPDPAMRLMATAFVDRSMPYAQRLVEPLFGLIVAEGALPRPPSNDATSLFISTVTAMHRATPVALVRRLLGSAAPPTAALVRECLAVPGVDPDAELPLPTLFSLVAFVPLRVARHELHHAVQQMSVTSSSIAHDEALLAQTGTPPISAGEDSHLAIASLELLCDLLQTSTAFSEPPESVDVVCSRVSVAVVDLLTIAVSARLPGTQVLLLRLLRLCVQHTDSVGPTRCRLGTDTGGLFGTGSAAAPGGAFNSGEEGADRDREPPTLTGSATNRRRTTTKMAPARSDTIIIEALHLGDFFRVLRHGIVAAAVAELHPTMSCFGLLSYWKQAVSALLPSFHSLLHSATYELTSVFCGVVRLVSQRPFAAATGQVALRCFQGLSELVQFLFLPSTKQSENVAANATGRDAREHQGGLLGGWFGVGGTGSGSGGGSNGGGGIGGSSSAGGGDATGGTTNLDLALRELTSALDMVVTCAVETFARNRRVAEEAAGRGPGIACSRADVGGALTVARTQLEAAIRALVEVLLRELELPLIEQLAAHWTRRNALGTHSLSGDDAADAVVIDLIASTSLVSPISLVATIDAMILRGRRGVAKGPPVTSRSATDLSLDATAFHMLLTYLKRCKGPDRLSQCFGPLLDCMLSHLSAQSPPSLQASTLALALLDVAFTRCAGATGSVEAWAKDKRAIAVVARVIEMHCTAGFADAEDSSPVVLSMQLLATALPAVARFFVMHTDRLVELSQQLFQRALVPALKGAADGRKSGRTLQYAHRTGVALAMLEALLRMMGEPTTRRFRLDVLELLFDQHFFRMPRSAVLQWRHIFELLTTDRSLNAVVMQRIPIGSAPTNIFTSIVTSHEEEAFARGRLLKRLAFYAFSCSTIDREFVAGVRDRIADTLRHYGRHGRQVAIRYALFVFRVLMTRVAPSQLSSFWPVVLPELIRVLCGFSRGLVGDIEVTLEALKCIDFALAILPAEFQAFRWVFLDDHQTTELVSPSPSVPAAAKGPVAAGAGRIFIPLVRALHSEATTPIPLSALRLERQAPQEVCDTRSAAAKAGGHQPLLSIPERCYYDLRGLEFVTRGLSLCSNAVSDAFISTDDDSDWLLGGAAAAAVDDAGPGSSVVRRGDAFDSAYVAWLLGTEFIHVAVAAQENQHRDRVREQQQQQQRAASAAPPGVVQPSSPAGSPTLLGASWNGVQGSPRQGQQVSSSDEAVAAATTGDSGSSSATCAAPQLASSPFGQAASPPGASP